MMNNIKTFNQLFENEQSTTVVFNGFECYVDFGHYQNNNRVYMCLIDKHNGELVADATVNIPEAHVPAGYALIKNYGENEGMVDALVAAKIVTEPKEWVRRDMAAICKLLVQPNKL